MEQGVSVIYLTGVFRPTLCYCLFEPVSHFHRVQAKLIGQSSESGYALLRLHTLPNYIHD